MPAILIAITVGAVALAVWRVSLPSNAEHPRASQKAHFKCTLCGHEFEMKLLEFTEWAARARPAEKDLGKADCPKCKAKFSAAPTTRCPKCQKAFFPDQMNEVDKGDTVEVSCPLCGAVLHQAPKGQSPKERYRQRERSH
jgi:Zn finger protein HypA/HybF involved in hydrogenase expression